MATYVNNLRLKEIATGDEDGTWGTSTNTNLELIGEALGYNTQDCFASDANATTTVADGATDPARALYFKVTSSATLTATRTLTIGPNTVSRVMIIENATTGSQSIAISQGSGANVTIPTGETKVVYLDGAGAGAAVVDTGIVFSGSSVSSLDINGGTIDGAVIGASSAVAGTFTDLTASGTVDFSGATVSDLGTVTTVDINGGTIDGADVTVGSGKTLDVSAGTFTVANDQISGDAIDGGTATPTTVTSTTVNATTVDSTNIEVTNLKAKDGTSAGSIADSTGVVTLASSVLTTTDINGGSVDAVTLGTNSAVTEAQVDNININGNTISSTDTNGNVTITPDGTGSVVISKVDVADGEIDGTAIGANSASTGSFTTLNATGGGSLTGTWSDLGTVTTVDIDGGTIDGTTQASGTINGPIAAGGTWTAAATWTLPAFTLGGTVTSNGQSFSGTIADLGTVTTVDINGGTIDGAVIGGNTAAAATVTTLSATSTAEIATSLIVGSTSVSPDGTLHVYTASAGSVIASTTADDLVVENSVSGGISILTSDASQSYLTFGSPSDNAGARLRWQQNAGEFFIGTVAVGASLILEGDNGVDNLTLSGASGSELAVFAGDVRFDVGGSQNYLLTDQGGSLALQGQSSGVNSGYEFYTGDGDGTDDVVLNLFRIGTPAQTTNTERLSIRSNGAEFQLRTVAAGSGSTNPIHIYTGANTNQLKLETDGTVSFSGDVRFDGSQNYLFTNSNSVLEIQGQSSATATNISLFSADGDATDDVYFMVYAQGTPGSIANRERLVSGYSAANSEFRIFSEEGGSGDLLPVVLFTEGNNDQLKLNTDGDVSLEAGQLQVGSDLTNASLAGRGYFFWASAGNAVAINHQRTASAVNSNLNTANALLLINTKGDVDNNIVSLGFGVGTTGATTNAAIALYSTAAGTGDLVFFTESGNANSEVLRLGSDLTSSFADAIGVHGVTPPSQASHITDASDLSTAITAINSVLTVLEDLGFVATS